MDEQKRAMFAQFEGAVVSITDEHGNEIGQGRLDANGVVHGEIDGVPYSKQLSGLVVRGED